MRENVLIPRTERILLDSSKVSHDRPNSHVIDRLNVPTADPEPSVNPPRIDPALMTKASTFHKEIGIVHEELGIGFKLSDLECV